MHSWLFSCKQSPLGLLPSYDHRILIYSSQYPQPLRETYSLLQAILPSPSIDTHPTFCSTLTLHSAAPSPYILQNPHPTFCRTLTLHSAEPSPYILQHPHPNDHSPSKTNHPSACSTLALYQHSPFTLQSAAHSPSINTHS